jgi:hypothetical protein
MGKKHCYIRLFAKVRGKFSLDKLARAAGDSLKNVLIADDGDICRLVTEKWFASETLPPASI